MSAWNPICVECHTITFEVVSGRTIYPHLSFLAEKVFWRCGCGAYVGVHAGTIEPLGLPAGAETRKARMDAHAAFDILWITKWEREKCGKGKAREAGYRWLAEQLGMKRRDCHISHMDAAMAWRVVEVCAPFAARVAA